MSIGVSGYSQLKQEHFSGIVDYISSVAYRDICRRSEGGWLDHRYWVFDMNAARPFYPIEDQKLYGPHLPSSSIIGPRVAADNGNTVRAVLMEIDQDNARELTLYYFGKKEEGSPLSNGCIHAEIHCGDSSELLLLNAQSTYRERHGYIYVDPNTPSLPDSLTEFFRYPCNQKIDLIINIAATSLKRKGERLDQLIAGVQTYKSKWLVREPHAQHQWTMLIGTNWANLNAWKKKGFHLLDSKIGTEVFNQLSKTRQELIEEKAKEELDLVLPTTNTENIVIRRNNGSNRVERQG